MNRIEGVRSACCAAWRRILQANMLAEGGLLRREIRYSGVGRVVSDESDWVC